jgi:hypothetical protein
MVQEQFILFLKSYTYSNSLILIFLNNFLRMKSMIRLFLYVCYICHLYDIEEKKELDGTRVETRVRNAVRSTFPNMEYREHQD